jgi:hypothetical protein
MLPRSYRNSLLPKPGCAVSQSIKRLEKKLEEETVGETVEAHFFGLEKL